MEDGPPEFRPGSTCPAVLGRQTEASALFAYRAITCYGRPFQDRSARRGVCNFLEVPESLLSAPATPAMQGLRALAHCRFGLFPVRSPLLWESRLISVPGATGMCRFAPFTSAPYAFRCGWPWIAPRRVAPLGYPRFNARLQLPGEFRRLPRPSSSSGAKSSTVYP